MRYGMHPDFGRKYIDTRGPDFETKAIGWGTFNIPTTIVLSRESGLPLAKRTITIDHDLSFEGNGKWRQVIISLPNPKK